MASKKVLEIMSTVRPEIERKMREKVAEILALCEKYRSLGSSFSYDAIDGLEDEINRALVELDDSILDAIISRIKLAIELAEQSEAFDDIYAYAKRSGDENPVFLIDGYSSLLKRTLEGWIALAFANKLSKGRIQSYIFSYMKDPALFPLWKDALTKTEFTQDIFNGRGLKVGKGKLKSPLEGMTLIGENLINTAYEYARVQSFKTKGAIGYRVVRGSTYDCPYCDSLCGITWPLTQMVVPSHIRCCCGTIPVFPTEM